MTLEAANVQVSCSILSTTHCSDDCPMWKVKLYATYLIASFPSTYLRLDLFAAM